MEAYKTGSSVITGGKIDAPVTSSQTIHPGHAGAGGASPLEWKVGDLVLDTYEVMQVFGSGGMAFVYRVHHRGWGIDLAVKSPRPEMLQMQGNAERFVKEAETWINLGLYPHIVSCYYIRVLAGVPRMFIEYVDGGSLADGIEKGWLYQGSPDQALERLLDIAIQFAWGLHYAHEKGLIHQDVKPGNVLLTSDGLAKVTDFGMAQARARLGFGENSPISLPLDDEGKSILVDTTGLTPAYCSPEQAAMRPLSRRTDVWSWAVSILEMFTGEKTWKGGPVAHKGLEKYILSGSSKPGIPAMPSELVDLLRRCLAVDPDARPRNMMALANELIEIYRKCTRKPYNRKLPRTETRLADTLNNRGVSMLDLGKEDEALQLFEAAIKTDTTHPAAVYNLNLQRWRKGQSTDLQALSALQVCQKQNPESWEPAYLMGLIHMERGDNESARRMASAAQSKFGELAPLKILEDAAVGNGQVVGGCVTTLEGSEGAIQAVAVSADGSQVLSGSNDNLVRLWSLPSGSCVRAMSGHDHLIRTVKFSPDGLYALSGSWDQTLRLWDLARGQCVEVYEGHTGFIQEVSFLPDGRQALSASSDCTLRLWDLNRRTTDAVFEGHTDTVWSVVVTPDGRTAVSGSYDNTIRIWDLVERRQVGQIDWPRTCTTNLSLSRNGKRLLLGGGDHKLWLIDLESGEPLRSYLGHTSGINSVQIAPNEQWAVSAGNDGTLRLWDLNTGGCLRTFTGHTSAVLAAAVCQRKAMVVTASGDQTLKVWRLAVGARAAFITVLPRSSQEIIEISTKIDTTLEEVDEKSSRGDYAGAMDVMIEARKQPEYQQSPALLERWDRVGKKGMRSDFRGWWLVSARETPAASINSLTFLRNPESLLVGGDEGHLQIIDLAKEGVPQIFRGQPGNILSVAASLSGERILSGSSDGSARIWKAETRECLKTLTGHKSEVNCALISPDGRLGLTGSHDHTIRLWDLNQGKAIRTYQGHTHFITGLAWHPNGRLAVSAGWDKTVCLWDFTHTDCKECFTGHEEVIDFVALSPDGRMAVSGGMDPYLRVWDLEEPALSRSVRGVKERVTTAVFSPDGGFLFTGEADGCIRVWETKSWRCLRTLMAHQHPVTALAISRDGNLLVSASADHTIKQWRLDWEYAFPEFHPQDRRLEAYLDAFLERHRSYARDGIQQQGRASWSKGDFEELLAELANRGFGQVDARTLDGLLKQSAKRNNW